MNELHDKDATSLEDIFLEARARLKISEDAESENRIEGIKALAFVDGEQWDTDVQRQRTIDARPALTINHTNTFCRRIENTLKQQRPRIKCHPISDAKVDDAKKINGLIRHIETLSNASVAYDSGGTSAIKIGWGYWRIVGEYVDHKSFDQELKIKPIRNTFTVYMDPSAVMPAGEDQQWCLISEVMKRSEYKRKYPKAINCEWRADAPGDMMLNWESKEEVRLAEYFRIHEVKDVLYKMTDGSVRLGSEMPDAEIQEALQLGIATDEHGKKISRPTVRSQIEWYRLNGSVVVEKKILPGKYIPVIRCEGNVLDVNGRVKRKGMVKDLMDPARMYNYWRCLALDTPIATPSGWSDMRSLKIGDQVFDESGAVTNVIGKSPVHYFHKCYRVTFDDGSSIVADDQHPWPVEERGKRVTKGHLWTNRLARTDELVPGEHFIKQAGPLQSLDADLPIDPYLLGVWLGDGSTAAPQIHQGDEDVAQMRANLNKCGFALSPNRPSGKACNVFTVYGQRRHFSKAGLLGNKHIPDAYLRASESQRLALLQGLMDTDGSCSAQGQCSFTNTNDRLSQGFAELLRSLGIKAVACKRVGRVTKFAAGYSSLHADALQFSFTTHKPVFRLARKLANIGQRQEQPRRARHAIVSVEPISSVPVQCIAVDSASHLFLAGESMIPTHNTAQTEEIALAPKAPWIAYEGVIEGHEEWQSANTKSYSVLVGKAVKGPNGELLPLPQRQQPAQVSAGFVEAAQGAERDLMSVAGMPQEDPQIVGRIVSGNKALQRKQGMADLTHWHYYDNQTLAIMWTGIILLDLIPYYYDQPRQQRIIGDDGVSQMIEINKKVSDENGTRVENDMTVGQFDVVMDTGPGYATKREEGAEQMMELLGTPLAEVVVKTGADVVLRNMDFNGADILADRAMTTNPDAMDKAVEGLPDQAKNIIGALKQQIEQQGQQIQQMGLEIKYKSDIEKMKDEGQTRRTLITSTSQAHDTETKAKTADINSQRDFEGWLTEIREWHEQALIKRATDLDKAEIQVGGALLNTHAEAAHEEKAADKAIRAGQTDRPTNGAH